MPTLTGFLGGSFYRHLTEDKLFATKKLYSGPIYTPSDYTVSAKFPLVDPYNSKTYYDLAGDERTPVECIVTDLIWNDKKIESPLGIVSFVRCDYMFVGYPRQLIHKISDDDPYNNYESEKIIAKHKILRRIAKDICEMQCFDFSSVFGCLKVRWTY